MRIDYMNESRKYIEGVKQGITALFPIESNTRSLELNSIEVDEVAVLNSAADVKKHLDAKLDGKSVTVPVFATLTLKDKSTGKTIDKKKVRILDLPALTNRMSFVVGGNDYQMQNQLRLRPGIYTRRKENGDLESFFNLSKGGTVGMSMWLNPEKNAFKMRIGTSNPPLYPLLKTLGITDEQMRKEWGDALFAHNRLSPDKEAKEVKKIYELLYRRNADPNASSLEAKSEIRKYFENTGVDPKTTEITLGKSYETVDSDALLRTSKKLLNVAQKVEEPDERDSLFFKNVYGMADLFQSRIEAFKREISKKVRNNLNTKNSINDIFSKDYLNKPVNSFVMQSSLSTTSDQLNPVAMTNAMTRTTLMGEGGLGSLDVVTTSMRSVSPSHAGMMDPLQTPESDKIGINLNMTTASSVENKEIRSRYYNLKTGKIETKTALEMYDKYVAFPDQYDIDKKKWNYKKVRALHRGKFIEADRSNIDYVIPHDSYMYSISTNMMPFLQNTQGNRGMVANKMFGQAVSLVNREEPLVQVKTVGGMPDAEPTSEKNFMRMYAPKSPVSGKIEAITENYIKIRGNDGKKYSVGLYRDFPLSDKSFLDSTPTVSVGQKVKKNQILSDDNFSKNKTLALGTNLTMAYVPFKDKTFEDGFVISESASKKLTSQHMYEYSTQVGPNDKLGVDSYSKQYPMSLTPEMQKNLDADGVIKVGSEVSPGDILVALLNHHEPTEEDKALGKLSKVLMTQFRDGALKWDNDHVGKVVRVHRSGKRIVVHVKAETSAEIGDKLVGRYGNKGVISEVLPDDEMPKRENGDPIDMVMSPYGVPSRINIGQIYETTAAKVAQKLGRPLKITNFPKDFKSSHELMRLAKEHKIPTKEKVFDPKTGRLLAEASVGPQYILKLKYMVDKKLTARGPTASYNSDLQPAKGGSGSARSVDRLTWNGLIAHGARENLREMATYKSERNPELWNHIRLGLPIPTPRTPFVTDKLFSYMNAAGINVKKEGNNLALVPFTDKDILDKSNGEIDDAQVMMAKTLRPIKDGLFDEAKTGGLAGNHWTHVSLAEPMPSPIMEKPILKLLELPKKKYLDIVGGALFVDKKTNEITTEEGKGRLTGGAAIKHLLSGINVDVELKRLKKEAKSSGGSSLDQINKKLRYLTALKENNMTPSEAYMTNHVPVLPPKIRPIYSLPDGSLSTSPINFLYRDLIMVNRELKNGKNLPEFTKQKLRGDLYKSVKALQGLGDPILKRGEKRVVGAVEMIKGPMPKEGYFQSVVFSKNQELTGQSTISPSVEVSPDEVMLPKKIAWNIYEPFIRRELSNMGYKPMMATKMIKDQDPRAELAMEKAVSKRPVWVNRAPSLHKLNILAMQPRLYDGQSIKINPLIVGGYNADFDGDTMGLYVPVTQAAVDEAKQFMPSKVLESPKDYSVMLKPSLDIQLGLFTMTAKGKNTSKSFSSLEEAEKAFYANKIHPSDVVTIGGYRTTYGRERLKKVLPDDILIPEEGVVKANIKTWLKGVADKHRKDFNQVMSDIAKLSAEFDTYSGVSLTLDDLVADSNYMKPFLKDVRSKLDEETDITKRLKILGDAIPKFNDMNKKWMKENVWKNNLATMGTASSRPGIDSLKQLKFTPMVLKDEHDRTVPYLIGRSYADGLTSSDYWLASYGARKGMIDRALQTAEPGYFAKQLISVTLNQVVSIEDCGTRNGVELNMATTPKIDFLWRFEAGTNKLIDSNYYEQLLRSKKQSVKVRSPQTCEASEGVCKKCYGYKENGQPVSIGDNVGAKAGQSVTEPTTQLTMKTFHTGAVATAGPSLASGFERVKQLTHFPKFISDRATLARLDGIVTNIEENPAGGLYITINQDRHFCPVGETHLKAGDEVKKGDPLTPGTIQPQELLTVKGMRATQDYLIDEMKRTFSDQGVNINRRDFETVVRATTNVTKITDPGGAKNFLPGDKVPLTTVMAFNKNATNPIVHQPELLGIDFSSKITKDWLAKLNTNRIMGELQEGVASRDIAPLHSFNPTGPYVLGKDFGKGPGGKY